MNTAVKSDRLVWLDSCKGFAISLVVLGHIFAGYMGKTLFREYESCMYYMKELIYSFHMPLFFLLSGYVFYMAYLKNIVERNLQFKIQILNNIYIYLLWSSLQWGIKMLFAARVNIKFVIADLLLVPLKPMDPYWYIYILILYYILFYCFESLKIDNRYKILIAFAISITGSCFNFNIIFPMNRFLYYFVFFELGIYLSRFPETKLMTKTAFVLYLTGSAILGAFMYTRNRKGLFIDVSEIIFAMSLSLLIVYLFANLKILYGTKILRLFGRYSLEIYVIHNIITAANRTILLKIGITNFYLNVFANFLMAVFIPILCSVFLKKIKLYKAVFKPASYLLNVRKKRQ